MRKIPFGMIVPALFAVLLLSSCANSAEEMLNKSDISEARSSGTASEKTTVTSGASSESAEDYAANDSSTVSENGKENTSMQMKIGDTSVTVEWEDNSSVDALRELCKDRPLTVQMSMYGGFEQVGFIGTDLPSSDLQTTTSAGDIVLYTGNRLVVFYGSNSWAYTRLGRITDRTAEEMKDLLSNGDVTITVTGGTGK